MDRDTTSTRKQAQTALNNKIEELLGNITATVKKENLRFSELVELYRKDQLATVSKSTYQRNYFATKSLIEILGADTLVDRLSAGYVREQLSLQSEKAGTTNERITRLKALIRWGYANDYIEDIRWLDKLKKFKDEEKSKKLEEKYLEGEELKTLIARACLKIAFCKMPSQFASDFTLDLGGVVGYIDQIQRKIWGEVGQQIVGMNFQTRSSMSVPKWRFLAELTALSGMRIGEAIALHASDVDFKQRIIKVTKTYDPVNRIAGPPKTSASNREIQMQDELYRLCREINLYMKKERLSLGYASDLFISDINGNHVNYYSYNAYLTENAERLFNKKVTSHFMRHTHVALMAEQGIPIEVISRKLGHTNSKITLDIYFHVTEKMKEKDMEQIKAIKIL